MFINVGNEKIINPKNGYVLGIHIVLTKKR